MQTTAIPPAVRPGTHPLGSPTCLCGAQVIRHRSLCRKCRARERWHRRNRLHEDNRRRTDAHRITALLGGAR